MILEISNFVFRIKRGVFRRLIKISSNPHPTSYPYISGDTFRSMANMIYDRDLNTIKTNQVTPNTIIFVEAAWIEKFFKNIHPQISNPYTLITHNGDNLIDEIMARYLDDKIIHWYAMAVLTNNPQITPLPAGLENLSYYNNGIPRLFDRFRKVKKKIKKNRIVFNFTIETNKEERQQAYDLLTKNPLADKIEGFPNAKRYLKTIIEYKFIACPPGNGIDSHRLWEALYLGLVPITKSSLLTEYFKNLGLPIWLIDDWTELSNLTETMLEKKYQELRGGKREEVLFADYWFNMIKNNAS